MEIKGIKVLVTGATGFVGGRLAERLVLERGANLKALIHRLSSPGLARLARLPVEIIQGDVLDISSLLEAASDCKIIIHLAYGKQKVTEKGTENVLKAAVQSQVDKVIHFSSSVVHGRNPPKKVISETAPFQSDGDLYSKGKIAAEKKVWKYHQKYGLPVVVFRPSIIYGPYNRTWTIQPVEKIKSNSLILIDDGMGLANIIYIDNLIDAIFLAIENDDSSGEAFLISDDDELTWVDFYRAYASMIPDAPPLKSVSINQLEKLRKQEKIHNFKKTLWSPVTIMKLIGISTAKDPEIKKELRNIPLIRYIPSKLPNQFKDKIRKYYNRDNFSANYRDRNKNTDLADIPNELMVKLYTSNTHFSNKKAKQKLGYKQRIGFEEAMKLTEEWLKYQRLI